MDQFTPVDDLRIEEATKSESLIRAALIGPAGSGKTLSSLYVASGLVGTKGKIGLIDTEQKSASLYAKKVGFKFNVVNLMPPYTVAKYRRAIGMLEEAGMDIIIIDSLTHAWAGEGGLLEKHSNLERSGKYKNGYQAWAEVTPDYNRLVDEMLQSPCHILATVRSKTEYVLEDNDRGKKVPRKVGMAPVQREGLDYEFTLVFDIDQHHYASVSKDRTGVFDGWRDQITPNVGKVLRQWLDDVDEAPEQDEPENKPSYSDWVNTWAARLGGNINRQAFIDAAKAACDEATDLADLLELQNIGSEILHQKSAKADVSDVLSQFLKYTSEARSRILASQKAAEFRAILLNPDGGVVDGAAHTDPVEFARDLARYLDEIDHFPEDVKGVREKNAEAIEKAGKSAEAQRIMEEAGLFGLDSEQTSVEPGTEDSEESPSFASIEAEWVGKDLGILSPNEWRDLLDKVVQALKSMNFDKEHDVATYTSWATPNSDRKFDFLILKGLDAGLYGSTLKAFQDAAARLRAAKQKQKEAAQ